MIFTLINRVLCRLSPSYQARKLAAVIEYRRRYGYARLQVRKMQERCADIEQNAFECQGAHLEERPDGSLVWIENAYARRAPGYLPRACWAAIVLSKPE